MRLTQAQIKGRIKNLAKENKADPRVLMRIYMMERFLERIAVSDYADRFIIKGGILVTSLVGVSMRSTMDIDTSVRNYELSEEEMLPMIRAICSIDLDDGVTFKIKEVSHIMDEMEYPGLRLAMDAFLGEMATPIKIDISTGDVITPGAIEYDYTLMLESRAIKLWSYNLETILAEKMQTILARGLLNTRMRDFYDVYVLTGCFEDKIDDNVLKKAFEATCRKRETPELQQVGEELLHGIAPDNYLQDLWSAYQSKFDYASKITYEDVIEKTGELLKRITE